MNLSLNLINIIRPKSEFLIPRPNHTRVDLPGSSLEFQIICEAAEALESCTLNSIVYTKKFHIVLRGTFL
jgi:hypothetical protein